MIATDLATTIVADTKDAELELTITLEDGTEITGDPISVNSKGVNVKVDGKVRSFGLKRIAALTNADMDEDDEDTDEDSDEDIYAELGEDMTTAELAAHLSDALNTDLTPKELRVHLRALGLGVGKGRKYSLTATEYRMVKAIVTAPATA
jgi:hypothetical protein